MYFTLSCSSASRKFVPASGNGGDLLYDCSRIFSTQAEVLSARQCEIDIACRLIEADICCEDSRTNIGRGRIQIVDWRESPTFWPTPQEAVITKVIIHVGNEDVEHHSSIELTCNLSRTRTIPCERIDQFGITAALAVFQTQHRESRQKWYARISGAVETA